MIKLNLKPIGENSLTWAEGFMLADMPRYEGGMRQLDWDKIEKILESKEFERIEVGLAEDYYQTHAVIYKDGKWVIEENGGAGFYGASRWATPAIKLTKNGETGLFECWVAGDDADFPDWFVKNAERISSYWDD